jgi:hypothetical protein
MKLVFWSLIFVLTVPVLLVLAIALGPVVVGILCAIGFGLIVFAIGNAAVGLAAAGKAFYVRAHRGRL